MATVDVSAVTTDNPTAVHSEGRRATPTELQNSHVQPICRFSGAANPLLAIVSQDTQGVRGRLNAGRVSSKLHFARYFSLIVTQYANFSNYLGRKQQKLPFTQV